MDMATRDSVRGQSGADYAARRAYDDEADQAVATAFSDAPAPRFPLDNRTVEDEERKDNDDETCSPSLIRETIGADFQWQFRASEVWVPSVPPPAFHCALFDVEREWLERRGFEARDDARAIDRRGDCSLMALVVDGSSSGSRHVRLLRLLTRSDADSSLVQRQVCSR